MLNLLQDSSLSTEPGPQKSSVVAKVQEREGKFPSLDPNAAPTANKSGEMNPTGNLRAGPAPPGSDLLDNLWQTFCFGHLTHKPWARGVPPALSLFPEFIPRLQELQGCPELAAGHC